MPENFVVFTVNGVDWRLARVCFTAAGVFFFTAGVLLTLVLRRYGNVRELSGSEAASVAMHAGETSEVDRAVTHHGYATGKAVEVSMSIGDLRRAYHEKDWFKFFALPLTILLGFNSFGLVIFGFHLLDRAGVTLGVALGLSVPVSLMIFFGWWAAIYTELE
jgi:hypothetical protein